MYHSVTFGDKNSWDDWHLIPTTRPRITAPQPKSKWVEIPGRDGMIEMNKYVFGAPTYGMREGNMEFVVHDYVGRTWSELYSEITMSLQGRAITVVLEDDPDFYYEGMAEISDWKSDNNWSTITIAYKLWPYKFEIDDDFKNWNPLDFELGHQTSKDTFRIAETGTHTITVSRKKVVPSFSASSEMTLNVNGKTYKIPRGYSRNPSIILPKGENVLTFTGNGRVFIDYQGGLL